MLHEALWAMLRIRGKAKWDKSIYSLGLMVIQ